MPRFIITYDVVGDDTIYEFRTSAPNVEAAKDDLWWQLWGLQDVNVNGILFVHEVTGDIAPRHPAWPAN